MMTLVNYLFIDLLLLLTYSLSVLCTLSFSKFFYDI